MKKPKRSDAMQAALDRLEALQPPPQPSYSLAWLGRQLNPPVSRQTVHGWRAVPEHYVGQVAKILAMDPRDVRPDLAVIFAPKKRPSRKRAA